LSSLLLPLSVTPRWKSRNVLAFQQDYAFNLAIIPVERDLPLDVSQRIERYGTSEEAMKQDWGEP
jgi:hypothetical protein